MQMMADVNEVAIPVIMKKFKIPIPELEQKSFIIISALTCFLHKFGIFVFVKMS